MGTVREGRWWQADLAHTLDADGRPVRGDLEGERPDVLAALAVDRACDEEVDKECGRIEVGVRAGLRVDVGALGDGTVAAGAAGAALRRVALGLGLGLALSLLGAGRVEQQRRQREREESGRPHLPAGWLDWRFRAVATVGSGPGAAELRLRPARVQRPPLSAQPASCRPFGSPAESAFAFGFCITY